MTDFSTLAALRSVRDMKLEGMQKLVLFALVSRADASGESWPSYATLASDTGLASRTVKRAVVALRKAGLMTVRGMNRPGSFERESNRYTLTLGGGDAQSPRGVEGSPPGDMQSLQVVTEGHGGGDSLAQEEIHLSDPIEGGEAGAPVSVSPESSKPRTCGTGPQSWGEGIRAGTGRPYVVARQLFAWQDYLEPALRAYGPQDASLHDAWLFADAKAFAIALGATEELTPKRYVAWREDLERARARAKTLEDQERQRSKRTRLELVTAVPPPADLVERLTAGATR